MADFVVCEGDPLTYIGVLADPANVVLVSQNGAVRKDLMPEDAYASVTAGYAGGDVAVGRSFVGCQHQAPLSAVPASSAPGDGVR
ncbi:hypothetical protein ACWGMA_45180 [Streptomyces asiaticus]